MLYRRLGPQAIQICFDVCSIHQMLLWGQPEPGPGYLSSWGDKNFNTRDKLGQLSHLQPPRNNLYDCNLYFAQQCGHLSSGGGNTGMVGANFA